MLSYQRSENLAVEEIEFFTDGLWVSWDDDEGGDVASLMDMVLSNFSYVLEFMC